MTLVKREMGGWFPQAHGEEHQEEHEEEGCDPDEHLYRWLLLAGESERVDQHPVRVGRVEVHHNCPDVRGDGDR